MKVSGEKIKDIRKRKKISRVELARLAKVSIRTLEEWEAGRQNPNDIDVVLNVAKALNVNLSELYSDEYIRELNAQALSDMDRFNDSDECERMLLTMIDNIYAEQGENGLAKLIDRFIFHVGMSDALKIVEGYINESGVD